MFISFIMHPCVCLNYDKAVDEAEAEYFAAYIQHMDNYVALETFSFDLP